MFLYPIVLTFLLLAFIWKDQVPKWLLALTIFVCALVVAVDQVSAETVDLGSTQVREVQCVTGAGGPGAKPILVGEQGDDVKFGFWNEDCLPLDAPRPWILTLEYEGQIQVVEGAANHAPIDSPPVYAFHCTSFSGVAFPGGSQIATCVGPHWVPENLPNEPRLSNKITITQEQIVTTTEPTTTTSTTTTAPILPPVVRQTQSPLDLLIASPEYQYGDADTMRLYRAFFRRDPDVGGAVYWINQTRAGVNYDDIAWAFANSTEFRNTYGTVSDSDFLRIVYGNVLGRTPDSDGLAYWTQKMNEGLARHLVVRWVAASNEFIGTYPYWPADRPIPAPPAPTPVYANCTDVLNRLGRPILPSDPGWQSKFDRDNNGIGCE